MFKLISRIRYSVKHQGALHALPKLIEVAMSCDTPEQCDSGLRYVALYQQKFLTDSPDGYTATSNKVLEQLAAFLIDTRTHVQKGFHNPEHNEFESVRKFPNMNDYVGKVLNVRFKPMWQRGVSSIAGM